jgi:hypothetical protein
VRDSGAALVVVLVGGEDPVCVFFGVVILVRLDDAFEFPAGLGVGGERGRRRGLVGVGWSLRRFHLGL